MKNHGISALLAVMATLFSTVAVAEESLATVERKALHGDYQAQRNLAYGYAAWPYQGQSKDPVLACAWYLVVLNSGSPKVGPGDLGNVSVYCGKGKLDGEGLELAKIKGRALYKAIYRAQPQF
ncbi:hypothetical protein [Rivihabitans pingtungensis]|uniref:hypothetical protein n=1 Tax=Rivihabitans pingtungensis TaxID=1054498 RepID=UPI002353EB72|nr:hypothetical protein [Rivihabitans pingtungensis]MCK6435989.1 hypothetical protein [Rivihabitans pingtungensis]